MRKIFAVLILAVAALIFIPTPASASWLNRSFGYRKPIDIEPANYSKTAINSTRLESGGTHFLTLDPNFRAFDANLSVEYENDKAADVFVEGNLLGTIPASVTSYTFTNVSGSWLNQYH